MKPRIMLSGLGGWECWSEPGGVIGFGSTPVHAYRAWLTLVREYLKRQHVTSA